MTLTKPKGAVSITKNVRKKRLSYNIDTLKTNTKNNGLLINTYSPPLADSSSAPYFSMLTPMSNLI